MKELLIAIASGLVENIIKKVSTGHNEYIQYDASAPTLLIDEMQGKVFDENGNVQLCGREKCKELIMACQLVCPDIDFGDLNSGFMNVDKIKFYVNTKL